MNVFDLLIGNTGQALQLVFQLGFLPVEENFLELTDEQYRQFSAEVGGVDEKLYMIVTSNGQDILDDDYNEISVVTEWIFKCDGNYKKILCGQKFGF